MIRKLEIILVIFWLLIILTWWIIPWLPQFKNIILPSTFLYFWILFGWIFLILVHKLKSRFTLAIAFILFSISALLTTVNLQIFAETIMRISLIGWMMGLIQALFEYI